MKIEIKIDHDTASNIVQQELIFIMELLRSDLQKHKEGRWCAVFSTNKKEDVEQIKAMIDAFETVLRYYAVKEK